MPLALDGSLRLTIGKQFQKPIDKQKQIKRTSSKSDKKSSGKKNSK